jgi:predicted TIM-barrel fold metal-dependent hydrolase
MRVIDAHLHVWSLDASRYPFHPAVSPPTARGDTDFLRACMSEAGVVGALVIQPIVYGYDHRYVTRALQEHGDALRGMCLIDPTHDDPPAELARLREEGYVAVRFNPNLFPEGRGLDSSLGRALFAAAGELEMPVGFLIGPQHFGAVDALCEAYPGAVAVIDHFGHCRPTAEASPEFEHLLGLCRHENLHVKLSEWPRASHEQWPYRDLHDWVFRLLDAYGPSRLMWATDFPFIIAQCGYRRGLTLLTEQVPGLGEDVLRRLLAGTAEKVFGRWGGG